VCTSTLPALPHVRSGQLRGLAVTTAARSRAAPDIPTVAEAASLPGYRASTWYALFAPARTPAPIVLTLHRAATQALNSAAVIDQLAAQGGDPLAISYRFSPGPIPKEHWTQDEEVGGGRLVGEACHAIDTCAALAGSPPVRVFAESVAAVNGVETTDDRAFLTVRHASGSISSISYQAGGDRGFPAERVEVFGGGRTALIDAWDRVELWQGGQAERVSGGKDRGHRAEVAAFLAACRAGGPWPVPWRDVRAVAQAALAAVRSLRDGAPYDLG